MEDWNKDVQCNNCGHLISITQYFISGCGHDRCDFCIVNDTPCTECVLARRRAIMPGYDEALAEWLS